MSIIDTDINLIRLNAKLPNFLVISVEINEAIDQLKTELLEAVSRCMVSDVPIGAFLSGGVDSSLVAALMQQASGIPIKTFSIGFTDQKYNEAINAKNIANQLGTSHTELYLTASEAQSIILLIHPSPSWFHSFLLM